MSVNTNLLFVGGHIVYCWRCIATFRMNLLPPSSCTLIRNTAFQPETPLWIYQTTPFDSKILRYGAISNCVWFLFFSYWRLIGTWRLVFFFKLFVPCIFSTYGMKTNRCHYFIRILLDFYMFRAHRPIFRRVRTAVHTTIGSVSVHTEHATRAVQILNQWLCEQLY